MRRSSLLLIVIFVFSCQLAGSKNYNAKKMDRIELNDGSSIKCKPLTKEQYDSMIKAHAKDITYLRRYKDLYELDVHLISNGEVLVREGDYYTLYYKLSDLDKLLNQAGLAENGEEVLKNKNPYGEKYPLHTNQLILNLANQLSVTSQGSSKELLIALDQRLDSMENGQEFKRDHFINLIAVVGEVLLKKYGGDWYMEMAGDNKTWNPYLIIKGQKVEFFVYLFEDVFLQESHQQTLSEIYETVEGIIATNLR